MPERRPAADDAALNAFWNTLVRPFGQPNGGGDAPDPASAEVVRRLHSLGAAPAPASSRERVRRAVRADLRWHPSSKREATNNGMNGIGFIETIHPATGSNGRVAWPTPGVLGPLPRERRRVFTVAIAAAAVMVLALGIAGVLLSPGWPEPDHPAMLPALDDATQTPAPPGRTEETLVEITLPAEALPPGDGASAGIGHFTISPGGRSTWEPRCCPGPMVEYVLEGAYTVRAEGQIRVVRADGETEEVPAGTEVVLRPGDSLISRNETAVDMANTGTTPVAVLNWILIDDPEGAFRGQHPGRASGRAGVQAVSVPAGSVSVRLQRVDLAPGAALPSPADGGRFVVTLPENEAGTPNDVTFSLGGTRAGAAPITVYVLTLQATGGGAGSIATASPTQ